MLSKIKGALFLFLIPAIFSLASIIIIKSGKTAEVVTVQAGNGLTTVYTVTASSSYRWQHESHNVPVGYLLFAISTIAAFASFKKDWMYIVLIGACWLGGAALIFYTHAVAGAKAGGFTQTYTAGQYEMFKDNPDKLFEMGIIGNQGEKPETE